MRRRLAAAVAWPVGHPAFMVLLLLQLALRIAVYARMKDSGFTGDEHTYLDAARALSNAGRDVLGLHTPDIDELQRSVVSSGWFMPGLPLLLTPLLLVTPDPSLAVVRAYLGLLTWALLLLATAVTGRLMGRTFALALMVVPGLVPMWVYFSFTAWGDLAGGLLAVMMFAVTVHIGDRLRRGSAPTLREGATLGLLAILTLYLRSSALPLVAGVFALLALGVLVLLRSSARWRGAGALLAGGALFVVLLFPWSFLASVTLGGRVITTTTVPVSMAVTFGDPDRICFGPCHGGNIWVSTVRYSRQVAQATGTSELAVQKAMSDYALTGLTVHDYAAQVLDNIERYAFEPSAFAPRFRPDRQEPDWVSTVVTTSTDILYFGALAVGAAGMLVVTRARRLQVTSVLVKCFLAALLMQPFVHISSGRYWPVFTPLLAMTAALLYELRRSGAAVRDEVGAVERRPAAVGARNAELSPVSQVDVIGVSPASVDTAMANERREARVSTALWWAQAVLATGFVAVVAGLLILGL